MEENTIQQTSQSVQNNTKFASTSDWMLTLFISIIPLIGFIMLLVWSVSDGTNLEKKNWARAALIWQVIGVLVVILFAGSILSLLGQLRYML